MNPEKKNEWLTAEELAEALKVSIGTVYYWVNRDEVPVLKAGRHLRFDLDEVVNRFRERATSRRRTCVNERGGLETALGSLKTKNAGRVDPQRKGGRHGRN